MQHYVCNSSPQLPQNIRSRKPIPFSQPPPLLPKRDAPQKGHPLSKRSNSPGGFVIFNNASPPVGAPFTTTTLPRDQRAATLLTTTCLSSKAASRSAASVLVRKIRGEAGGVAKACRPITCPPDRPSRLNPAVNRHDRIAAFIEGKSSPCLIDTFFCTGDLHCV